MSRTTYGCVIGLFLVAGAIHAPDAWAQAFECREVMVPMRDGVKLATDVYMPQKQGPGPFPVVMERTPYDKGHCENPNGKYFALRGYVAIVQDERGRYASEGEYYWLRDEGWGEHRDGYDSIEWAGTQSWSNGKVGTMGLSFTCLNQYLTAPTRPPHLAAMFCAHSASNAYKDLYWAGGALHLIMPSWLLTQAEMARPFRMNFGGGRQGYVGSPDTWTDWYTKRVESGAPMGASMISAMMTDMIAHPYYDDYWRQFAIDEHWKEIDVPIFHYASWYDRYPHSQVKHFNGIRAQGGPRAREAQKLFIGPWTHGASEITARVVGDLDFGPDAAIDYNALRKRWFDQHLRGIDTGVMKEPPVRIFVMGANTWRDEQEFPLARTVHTDYFLRSGPTGSIDSLNDGLLAPEKPGAEKPDAFKNDPRRPVPSIGGDLFIEPMGARDHRPADRQSLTFTTPPLERDTEVTGLPKLEFYASSSAVDTDWTVALTDVHPDGYSQILRQNILRARYREGDTKPVLLTPGQIYKLAIEMYPVSNLFKKGHRIRVTIASSAFPKWYPTGNTGKEMDQDLPGVVATNTLYHDSEHPSRMILPVIPALPARSH
ncbi:MAG: CocE/NonD family hydrolase [Vicinamibacterales bacterium]